MQTLVAVKVSFTWANGGQVIKLTWQAAMAVHIAITKMIQPIMFDRHSYHET